MTTCLTVRTAVLAAGAIAAAMLIGFFFTSAPPPPQATSAPAAEKARQPAVASLPPSLNCTFNAFMHSSTAISFYFDVALGDGETPRFHERAFVSADGAVQAHDDADRPAWTYSLDGDGQPTISSPDGATHIVLYGLKLGAPGSREVEAGIRSNVFRNLGGKCMQTNLDGTPR